MYMILKQVLLKPILKRLIVKVDNENQVDCVTFLTGNRTFVENFNKVDNETFSETFQTLGAPS